MEIHLSDFDKISANMLRYRKLKADSDFLRAKMDVIKAEIKALVEEGGTWQDDLGYARIVTREGSVKYDSYALDILCQSMTEINELLSPYRKVTASSSYLQVK